MKTDTLSLKLINGKFTLVEKTIIPVDYLTIILLIITFIAMVSAGYLIYIL